MYTLLIADDEPLIRNGVKNIIDWESLGFSTIFLAEDGQEALEIIRSNKVDLVLTDIVMPFMDGREMLGLGNSQNLEHLNQAIEKDGDGYFKTDINGRQYLVTVGDMEEIRWKILNFRSIS